MSDPPHLGAHGERQLAFRVQGALERMYQLDRVVDVRDFLQTAEHGQREALLVREAGDGALEVRLNLPRMASANDDGREPHALDTLCQIIEGVSHFVYVIERARMQRGATMLELELQAEVDKWLVLAASIRHFDARSSAALRARLYEHVAFAHASGSEVGDRYRIANDLAHRFVRRLERDYVRRARYAELRDELRCFFRHGQEEKLRLGRAA